MGGRLWTKRWMRPGAAIACIAAIALVAVPAGADSITGIFTILDDTTGQGAGIAGQFSVVITETVTGAAFEFFNAGPVPSYIQDIYWDDATPPLLDYTHGVLETGWSAPAHPGNLPGGNNADPVFVATSSADDDDSGGGIGPTQSGVFTFAFLDASTTFEDLVSALLSGSLRLGLHVQGIGDTGDPSASYISYFDAEGNVVPVPPPAAIGLLGMGILGAMRVRSRRRAG